jgi:RNA polymerase sigma-70 factor (ECF subfamily)
MQEDGALIPALLEEASWVRGLAAQLVRGDGADDVAQDAVVAALDARPATDRSLKPWLATVVRKLAHTRRRGDARRRGREQAAAAEPAAPAGGERADDQLARAELLRLLGELVASLDEPSRSTVLLHYYEGLSSRQIAEREGVADATVRWRLARALDELRAALDRRTRGGRRAWCLALAPLAHPLTKGVGMIPMVKVSVWALSLAATLAGVGLIVHYELHGHGANVAPPTAPSPPPQAALQFPPAHFPPTPPPPADATADEDILKRAQDEYVHGNYNEAIRLGRQVTSKQPTRAWRIVGAASCFKHDGAGAAEAYDALEPQGRNFLRYVCERNGTKIDAKASAPKPTPAPLDGKPQS